MEKDRKFKKGDLITPIKGGRNIHVILDVNKIGYTTKSINTRNIFNEEDAGFDFVDRNYKHHLKSILKKL